MYRILSAANEQVSRSYEVRSVSRSRPASRNRVARYSVRVNSTTEFDVTSSYLSSLANSGRAILSLTEVAMSHSEKSGNELELLRTALSLDHTLFTVQRHTSRPKGHVRVDCFASKGAGNSGLTRITGLVAGVLKYHRNVSGLTMSNGDDVDRNLVVALSRKLELDLKHERLNSDNHYCSMLFF